MNKVLIISDNLHLCQISSKLFSKYEENFKFDYSISPFSNLQAFKDGLESHVDVFNLKYEGDIEIITSKYDLVISMHCKQLFPKTLFENVRCINIHPGYNPINRGWYPQVFAIINNNKIGATIHAIDGEIDHGGIIDRGFVDAEIIDTSKTLYDKILEKEMELLEDNLESILQNSYDLIAPEDEGDLYLKKDFNDLCKLNLEENLSMLDCINKLRALTHGDYKNAYFIDPKSGKKVFVSVSLNYEL